MNHDTNREDRVESEPIARLVKTTIFYGNGAHSVFYPKSCLSCGALSDPYGNLPCPCGQQIDDGHDGREA
jgi:hypothetical protein